MNGRWTEYERRYLRFAIEENIPYGRIAIILNRGLCAVRAAGKRFGVVRFPRFTAAEIQFIRENEGKLPATEIARRLGRPIYSIHNARHRMGLGQRMAPHGAELEAFIRQKHALGWSDSEIAVGYSKLHPGCRPIDRHCISVRRRRWGLADNTFSEHRRRQVAVKTAEQLRKVGIPALSHLRLAVWRERARAQGWPEDLSPPYIKILNALWDFGPQTRRELVERCGMRWKGSRQSMHSNDPNGSYLAHLMARGLVIRLGRVVYNGRQGGNTFLYMISPNIQRKKVTDVPVQTRHHRAGAAPALAGGDPQRGVQRHQIGRFAGHLRQTG